VVSSLRARLRLAERYADSGLLAAARATLERARREAGDEAPVLEARCRLELAAGDPREARRLAAELTRREPGIRSRLLLGEAQLAAGERDGARFTFAAVLESSSAPLPLRARALLGRARVAGAEGDEAGAGAAAMTAFDELLDWAGAPETDPGEVAAQVALFDRAIELAARAGRGSDVEAAIASASAALPLSFFRAALLAARRAADPGGVGDAELEAALATDAPRFLPARFRLAELRLRRRHRDRDARDQAVTELESLAAALEPGEGGATLALAASVQLLLATAFEDEPSEIDRAADAYRRGLALRPGQLLAAIRLAALSRATGDRAGALAAARTALVIDPESHLGWIAAARACGGGGVADEGAVADLLDAAEPGAGLGAAPVRRLLEAAAEVTRAELLAAMHARGHRVKNLLGIIGSRTRKARKLAVGELADRLADLEQEVTALYEEWSIYLRSMQATGRADELVPLGTLIESVVAAASDGAGIDIELSLPERVPELFGDPMLLREALLNLVQNAVEACGGGGEVAVAAEVRIAGSAPLLAISIVDGGSGIPAADLARVTAPGFTTKESGSGLGLSVAERVIADHRGRLLIDSEVGRGTRITVLLPLDIARELDSLGYEDRR
jgi:signal transduction histidine kinase